MPHLSAGRSMGQRVEKNSCYIIYACDTHRTRKSRFLEPREQAIHGPLILLEGRDGYTSLIPIAEATPVAARAEA